MPFILQDAAEAELRAALDYYEQQRAGLGSEFRVEFEAALERVRGNPQLYALEDESAVRFCPFRRFPYTLVYLEHEERIWVVAVMHQKRRPGYWARRLPS